MFGKSALLWCKDGAGSIFDPKPVRLVAFAGHIALSHI
jgi:hypothetical protein